jgi:hypothetical protein
VNRLHLSENGYRFVDFGESASSCQTGHRLRGQTAHSINSVTINKPLQHLLCEKGVKH